MRKIQLGKTSAIALIVVVILASALGVAYAASPLSGDGMLDSAGGFTGGSSDVSIIAQSDANAVAVPNS